MDSNKKMVKKCCGRHREHSTEDLDSVRESKQNKASDRLLTFAPLPQQRAALSVHLRRKNLDLLTPNRAGASYFLPPIFVRVSRMQRRTGAVYSWQPAQVQEAPPRV